jgi:hypothetical protein
VFDFGLPSFVCKSIQYRRGHILNAHEIGGEAGVHIRVVPERHDAGMS